MTGSSETGNPVSRRNAEEAAGALGNLRLQAAVVRGWLTLAIGVLLLAGCLALGLVIARMPPFSLWITDAQLFKRVLVVHVDLSLVVWLYAFVAALFCLIPTRNGRERHARWGLRIAVLGTGLMVASAGMPGAGPVLANYVPMIDHGVFVGGLVLFGAGTSLALADRARLLGHARCPELLRLPPAAYSGLRALAVVFQLAMVTFAISAITTPTNLSTQTYYEFLVWGGGHVLQFASVTAMVTVWIILLSRALHRPVIGKRLGAGLFAALVVPLAYAPVLASSGTTTIRYYDGFTQYMRWGIAPVLVTFLALCLRAMWRARRDGTWPARGLRDPALAGFVASATLTVLGVGLGFLIRGSNTVVPGHYHAAIGGVTVAFMAMSYPLLERLGFRTRSVRLARATAWQPLLFAGGQAVFALGFAIAGMYGMGRKTYGTEQHIRGFADYLGLGIMGVGGLIAVAAGILFLIIAVTSRFQLTHARENPWTASQNIPSRS